MELPLKETSFRGVILFTNSKSLDRKVFAGDIASIQASVALYANTILQERHRLQKRKGIEIPQRGYKRNFYIMK